MRRWSRSLHQRLAWPIAALALFVPTTVCRDNTVTGTGCVEPGDCEAGFGCFDGECLQLCIRSVDCDGVDQRCDGGACVPVPDADCDEHVDCTSGLPCDQPGSGRCHEGSCSYAPRRCDTPPAATCISSDTVYRAYGSTGVCAAEQAGCVYEAFDTPCTSCASTCLVACAGVSCPPLAGGCRADGHCNPLTAQCVYDNAANGTACDQPGSPPNSDDGICFAGSCEPASSATCLSNASCTSGTTCIGGFCRPISGPAGPCDAGDQNDCDATTTCDTDTCLLDNAQNCLANDQCLGTCIQGVCADVSDALDPCDTDDQEDCSGTFVCANNACRLGPGEPCISNGQCAETCRGGSCEVLSPAGGPCDSGESEDCLPNHSCTVNTCLGQTGEVCGQNSDCVDTCVGGFCSPPIAAGGVCDTDDSDDCASLTSCVGTTCLLNNGQGCGSNASCVNICLSSFCGNRSSIDGLCDLNDSADCAPNLTCQTTTCKGQAGAVCSGNAQCATGYTCLAGSCVVLRTTGESCDAGDSGDCITNHTCTSSLCKKNNGQTCTASSECSANQCECDTWSSTSCTLKTCHAANCVCRYGVACTTNIPNGSDDDEDCINAGQSCYGGACRSDTPGSCDCTNCDGSGAVTLTNSCGTGWSPTHGCWCEYYYGYYNFYDAPCACN